MDTSINIADSVYHQQFHRMNKEQKLAILDLYGDMNENYKKDWLIEFVGHPRHIGGYTISDAVAYSQFLVECSLGNIYFLTLPVDKWAQSNSFLSQNKAILQKLDSGDFRIKWLDNGNQVFDGYALCTNIQLFQLGHDDNSCDKVSSNTTQYTGECFIEIGSVPITKFVANLFSNKCGARLPYSISFFLQNALQPRVALFLYVREAIQPIEPEKEVIPVVEELPKVEQLSLFG